MISQLSLSTAKGRFAGTLDECAAWLAEMQPSFPGLDWGEGRHGSFEVEPGAGAAGYRQALQRAALAAVSDEWKADPGTDGGRCAAIVAADLPAAGALLRAAGYEVSDSRDESGQCWIWAVRL